MGKSFDELLNGRRRWGDGKKADHFLELLARAIEQEEDVANEAILDALVDVSRGEIQVTEPIYRALAARGEPGWLAEAARRAAKSPERARRIEGCRWLRYGRAGTAVADRDLETLRSLLTDKNSDVRSVALYPLAQFVADDPDKVVPAVLDWVGTLSPVLRPMAIAALTPAWGASSRDRVFAVQREWVRDPKLRFPFLGALEQVIHDHPPSLRAAEAGWDGLLAPALGHLLAGDWGRGQPQEDATLVYLMGDLMALRPAPPMIRRAEGLIGDLLRAREPVLSPVIIAMRPRAAFGRYASAVWPGYASWLAEQIDRIAAEGGDDPWKADLKQARRTLEALQAAGPVADIPPKQLDTFRRSALEFACGLKREDGP